jgi:hypothetical protein
MGNRATKFKQGGSDPALWPPQFRVQQMPRIYDAPPAASLEEIVAREEREKLRAGTSDLFGDK